MTQQHKGKDIRNHRKGARSAQWAQKSKVSDIQQTTVMYLFWVDLSVVTNILENW